MSEDGFFTKVTRSVKGFVSSALKAAPMTAIYSGGAFLLSSVMQSQFGVDPLNVAGADGATIMTRIGGSALIGATLSGAVGGFQAFNNSGQTAAPASTPTTQPRQPTGNAPQQNMGMNNVVMPFTPTNPAQNAARFK